MKMHLAATAAILALAACNNSELQKDAADIQDSFSHESDSGDEIEVGDVVVGTLPVGSPCMDAEDCSNALEIEMQCLQEIHCPPTGQDNGLADTWNIITFPGGYCSLSCTSSAECGEESGCASYCGMKLCLELCAANSDCRAGYPCLSVSSDDYNFYCIPIT